MVNSIGISSARNILLMAATLQIVLSDYCSRQLIKLEETNMKWG